MIDLTNHSPINLFIRTEGRDHPPCARACDSPSFERHIEHQRSAVGVKAVGADAVIEAFGRELHPISSATGDASLGAGAEFIRNGECKTGIDIDQVRSPETPDSMHADMWRDGGCVGSHECC